MAKVLTAKAIEKLKPGKARREIPDAHTPGLYLVIQPSGRKSWAVRTRVAGKPVKVTLKALDLTTARDEAREIVELARAGKDPRREREHQQAEANRAALETVEAVCEDWLAKDQANNRTVDEVRAIMRREVLPHIGTMPIAAVRKRDIIRVVDIVAARAPIRANRVLAWTRRMFGWAAMRDLIDANPAQYVEKPADERSRDRVLSDTELTAFWRATEALGWPWGHLFRTLALTLQRVSEVSGLSRNEIDGDLWTLSRERTKAGRVHDTHLVPAVLDIIENAPEIVDARGKASLVFTISGKPLSGFSAAKRRLDALMRAELGDRFKSWRLHDLRRTGASNLARMGFPIHVVSALLNHSPGSTMGVSSVYVRHRFAEERRRALEAWAAHVLGLVEPQASNVVAMQA